MVDLIKKIHVLLVENKDSGMLLEDILKESSINQSIEITTFNDENELLNFLNKSKTDEGFLKDCNHAIIMFNVCLPLDNLPNAIKTIKEDLECKYIPIFVVTPSIEKEEIVNLYKCHVNCYVVKPNDLKGLIAVMDSFKAIWFNQAQLP